MTDFHINEEDSSVFSRDRDVVVAADVFKDAVAAKTYLLAIDLDNAAGAGPYRHPSGATSLELVGISGVLLKNTANSKWDAILGVVLAIDGTNATIAWLQLGSLHARDTGRFEIAQHFETFPVKVDLAVSGGDLTKIAAGFKETTTDLNTGVTIDDVAGNARTPAVGDLVLKVDPPGGPTGQILVHYSLWYKTS